MQNDHAGRGPRAENVIFCQIWALRLQLSCERIRVPDGSFWTRMAGTWDDPVGVPRLTFRRPWFQPRGFNPHVTMALLLVPVVHEKRRQRAREISLSASFFFYDTNRSDPMILHASPRGLPGFAAWPRPLIVHGNNRRRSQWDFPMRWMCTRKRLATQSHLPGDLLFLPCAQENAKQHVTRNCTVHNLAKWSNILHPQLHWCKCLHINVCTPYA